MALDPTETMLSDTALSDTVLSDTVLSDTVLSDTVLSDTVLSDTVLSDTVPSPTAPTETPLDETMPAPGAPVADAVAGPVRAAEQVVGDASRAGTASVCVVVPAFNEAPAVGEVVAGIRRYLPSARVVVVDDGSVDDTAGVARRAGAAVIRLPVNLGIGGAVQAGYRYALRHGFTMAMQVDGDGQHEPAEALRLVDAVLAGADLAVGSRWLGRGDYVAPRSRRTGMHVLSAMVRLRTGQVFTDTTSGFRALGPMALRLFAETYPTDFPEVESIVLAARHGLEVVEVPVRMSEREHGSSSIAGGLRSSYYMARVSLALLAGGLPGTRR
jgi:uncharacterized protein YjbI with pentapeptide repeats